MSAEARAPLVDTHVHIFDGEMPFTAAAWIRPNYAFTAEAYIATLDRYGISFGVIAAASLFGTYNDYVIASLQRHPRLRATAIVHPSIDGYTLARMRDDGITGIRMQLLTQSSLPSLDDDDHRRLFRRLRDLDMHVHILVDSAKLDEYLTFFRAVGVKTVIDHFGSFGTLPVGAEHVDMIARAAEKAPLWVKLSAGFRFSDEDRPRALAGIFVNRLGPDRLFWGSDAPFVGHEDSMSYDRAVASFCDWLPDPRHRAAVSEASLRFYFPERVQEHFARHPIDLKAVQVPAEL